MPQSLSCHSVIALHSVGIHIYKALNWENYNKSIMNASRATLIALVCIFSLATASKINEWLSDDFIDLINSKQNMWKAERTFSPHIPMKHFNKIMGVIEDPYFSQLPVVKHDAELIASLPEKFDLRDKWPNCPTLNEIRDQGNCGNCWAISAVEAMTDRYCIYSNGTQQFYFSTEDLLSCCTTCGYGCRGGWPSQAWMYWKNEGIVSGGNYNSNQGCSPYQFPPCVHQVPATTMPCMGNITPKCQKQCAANYGVDYNTDKRYGKTIFSVMAAEDHIKAELFKNGPVQAVFTVYADFLNYKSGVYVHTVGGYIGHHAAKMIGWGEENCTKYWLFANSWNSTWGDNGFFKVLRGTNHCDIENREVGGEPVLVC